MVQVDLTNTDSFGSSGPYTEGIVRVKIDNITHGETQNGDRKLEWEFEIQEGEDKGRPLFGHTPIEGKGKGSFKAVLEALNPDKEWGKVDTEDIIDNYTGEQLRIYVTPDTYNGKNTANIDGYYPLEGDTDTETTTKETQEKATVGANEDNEIPF